MFQNIGEMVILFWRTVLGLPAAWGQSPKLFDQFFEIGNASVLMVCILSFFIGGGITLHTAPLLVKRGLSSAVGGVVGVSICKELAPVMMSILIAGRIGSAMAAEIGSMAVYQEIDALRTMNIQPVNYLVLPRLVAICISLPVLVIFAILVGWVGGALVSVLNSSIELSLEAYFNSLRQTVELRDVINGIVKTLIFAIFIGTVSCHQGLETRGGPRGIGRSVTKAVVNSIGLILILDYFITRALMWFDEFFPR